MSPETSGWSETNMMALHFGSAWHSVDTEETRGLFLLVQLLGASVGPAQAII